MESRRVIRYLRVTVIALCGTGCVLLMALSARSYYSNDRFAWLTRTKHFFQVDSECGRFWIVTENWDDGRESTPFWSVKSLKRMRVSGGKAFRLRKIPFKGLAIVIPHWLPLAAFAMVTIILWSPAPWRFSLRTLLIATALVAAALGIIAAI